MNPEKITQISVLYLVYDTIFVAQKTHDEVQRHYVPAQNVEGRIVRSNQIRQAIGAVPPLVRYEPLQPAPNQEVRLQEAHSRDDPVAFQRPSVVPVVLVVALVPGAFRHVPHVGCLVAEGADGVVPPDFPAPDVLERLARRAPDEFVRLDDGLQPRMLLEEVLRNDVVAVGSKNLVGLDPGRLDGALVMSPFPPPWQGPHDSSPEAARFLAKNSSIMCP